MIKYICKLIYRDSEYTNVIGIYVLLDTNVYLQM